MADGSNDNTAARLDELDARVELGHLINEYHWRADMFEWKSWSETFVEDAEFEFANFGTMHGRQEIHDTCKGNMDDVYETQQHLIVNLDFDVTGPDTATGRGNLLFTGIPKADKPEAYYQAGGRYQWKFKRTAEGWRITWARLEFIWTGGQDEEQVFSKTANG